MNQDRQAPAGERLAKVIARAGVCSRRDAESWITAGRVWVNGSPVKTPAFNVTEADAIAVDGKPVARRAPTQLWLYHKPAGLMVTEKDPEGRPTVFAAFAELGLPRVVTVGRLDFNTEGLLLLTNDGGLKRTLELPATGWVRRYRVRAFGAVTQAQLDALKDGITVEGVAYGPIEAVLDSAKGSNVWLTMGLREGKNREVRNVLGALGLEVNRLIRLSYGPFQLGELAVGAVEKVKTRVLRDQLGKRLADSAGADFDSPPAEEAAPRRREPEPRRAPERDRFGGLKNRPAPGKRFEARPAQARTLHFDDGRPSERFVPGGDGKRGERPAHGEGFAKRDGAQRRAPRREGDRPVGKGSRGDGDKPFAKGPRQDGDRPFAKGPRRDGDKPFRKGPPRDGDRPFAKGPRQEGDTPFVKGPRRGGDTPPARGPGRAGGKPPGKGPRREGEKSLAKGPRRGGDTPGGKGPRRGGKPDGGGRSFAKGGGTGAPRGRGPRDR